MKGVLIALDYQLAPSKRKSIWIKNSQEQKKITPFCLLGIVGPLLNAVTK